MSWHCYISQSYPLGRWTLIFLYAAAEIQTVWRTSEWLELCFWLYLINSTSRNQDWFKTLYFKTWVVGSIVAIIYMPLVTILSRSDNLKVRHWQCPQQSIAQCAADRVKHIHSWQEAWAVCQWLYGFYPSCKTSYNSWPWRNMNPFSGTYFPHSWGPW